MKSKMQKFSVAKKKAVATKRTKGFQKIQEKRKKKKEKDDSEIEALRLRLWPPFGHPKEEINPADVKNFSDLPISKKTLEGLKNHNFITPTDIQRESLMFGLKGHDILGAAKTGSGKTLAFLIPILETLFKQRYSPSFGMAALVISPTRELAFQSFDVLKKIGKLHDLSFGLVTGGMHLKEEAQRMHTTNVVICTPGRLLQHFEQTPNFSADELKILVLDEADRILHMGFCDTMNSIIEALPKQRQTLLFSATQTKSVKDLARLSLKRPIYVSVHEKAKEMTPATLDQRYIICEMHDKVNMLWSFLRSHRHKKILVFLSCCKQTRYLYQVLKKMHPGLTVLCLHGHMKQHQRMEVYHSFSRKQHAVLLATDVAARGLDFPVVNWVVQMDKPENSDTYIHRVGRTARYEKSGEALLVLLPSEEKKMVDELKKRKIPIVKLKVSKKRVFDVTKKLESICASEKEMKDNAQKAFVSVMKTLYVLDKPSFDSVDLEAFAASLGLVQAPRLPFLEKSRKTGASLASASVDAETKMSARMKGGNLDSQGEEEGDDGDEEEDNSDEEKSSEAENEQSEEDSNESEDDDYDSEEEEKAHEKMKALKSKGPTLNFGIRSDDDEDDDNDDDGGGGSGGIYKVVKNVADEALASDSEQMALVEDNKSRKKKSKAKEKLKLLKYTKRITFDDEGNMERGEEEDEDQQGLNIAAAKKRMLDQDKLDKEEHRRRIREMHRVSGTMTTRMISYGRLGVGNSREGCVGGTVDSESAQRSEGPFFCGFEPHHQRLGLTEGLKT
ncbi:RNA helicase [Plakobranchus ocellatus]|uniref:ATP-dependent RNA helicase n=1 Tax=Plakobranchus ocellatus TaxID=259542 RepID=A0AAV3XYW9_9GAST|nr:RNA helicase [Plakobranchus ocellatus]